MGLTPTDRLFCTRNGRPLCPQSVRMFLRDACRDAGIEPHLTPHSFRRGAVREARRHGMDGGDFQQWGGWKDPRMVQRYGGEQAVPLNRDRGIAMFRRDQAARAAAMAGALQAGDPRREG
ncbi:tyrosine-type recombinase/integrase [Streptomyces sp. NPDC057680]|uniref:tyrosine-type recombinase/integrase n=1 Tax=Streptomyces sp. NPDC057680 TaxID=3346208 RepID=UPI00368271D0